MLAAVEKGDVKKVVELIRQDPSFKVNVGQDGNDDTLLHYACWETCSSVVIPLLLAHPDIDANSSDRFGRTPFYLACDYGHTSCVREMLKDSRVKVNEPHSEGQTPLYMAAFNGHLEVIKWWIASGREMNLLKPGSQMDAIEKARWNGKKEVVTLLERFKKDATKTRSEIRKELGINGQYSNYSVQSYPFHLFHSQFMISSIFYRHFLLPI